MYLEVNMIFNVSEAKANLSKLINMAFHGEEVVIAKNNLPLVELVVYKPKSKIVFGLLAEAESDDFNEGENLFDEDEELNELFYSSEINPQ
jgi:prevent-host-death family protein